MKKIILILIAICFLGINYQVNADELQANASISVIKDPGLIKIPQIKNIDDNLFEEKMQEDDKEYEKIKKELGEENFELYKIFERLLRANNLQYQNWRITFIMDVEEINAYANAYNLLNIGSALYDSLYPNEDAIAFVIAHELSHHLLNHGQINTETRFRIKELEEKLENARAESNRQRKYSYWSTTFNDDYSAMAHSFSNTVITFNAEIMKNKLNKEYELLRSSEFAADSEAIVLMTRANYNTSSAMDTMEVLDKLPNIETKQDTHPNISARINNIKSKVYMINEEQLKRQGKFNLYNSKVLKAKKTTDKKALILFKDENIKKTSYMPESQDLQLLRKGYLNYKKGELESAQSDFKKAFETNSSNYISALYLSYLNEYLYKKNHDKKLLKEAKYWADKAYKINPNTNTTQQKQDTRALYEQD